MFNYATVETADLICEPCLFCRGKAKKGLSSIHWLLIKLIVSHQFPPPEVSMKI